MVQGLGDVAVTEGLYYLPSGKSPQHRGILSDIVLPAEDPNLLESGEKDLKYSLGESEKEATEILTDWAHLKCGGSLKAVAEN